MKKLQSLGRSLSKDEQKSIVGGPMGTCSAQATNCTKSCSCDTAGSNSCSSSANSVTCKCDGIEVTLNC